MPRFKMPVFRKMSEKGVARLLFPGGRVDGILCDITGVLRESSTSGDGIPIQGSLEALELLSKSGIQIRFVTNESKGTVRNNYCRPFLLVHDNVLQDFEGLNSDDPTCVVIGDAVDKFSYENLNKAFRLLKEKECDLISLGKGKYYREDGELTLDVGPYTAALEFAADRDAIVCGKPDKTFFQAALNSLGLPAERVIMIGDDIVSDVGGAQKSGIRGVLVRSGKYTQKDENHPVVKPDLIVDNLKALVDLIVQQ
ncbi:phospholysine phosphohistidine inorganic pyrophosphate phosphatase [Eurytemora carolleeae]|uniref:phospholysine phosphohistidine inorganic pyrophosphate phosphatase n=1 Tax=Eurytemora carolleeae TaxID=1294199 RepID=UPI000C793F67|nr:phospholysine phosphohistidine inorganic pyrophosphate phosphatase [Eurytemora carolleeae]|eukprot:XP_023339773.1 phospholysine phosphohistidine inorganic pyrophosphate phosphatase-like [Eurytemora affinis]